MEGEAGGFSWLLVTAGGVVVLGLAIAYGIYHSRGRRTEGPLPGPALRTGTHSDTPTEVRQGSREGVVRPILGISVALAVIAMVIVYFLVTR